MNTKINTTKVFEALAVAFYIAIACMSLFFAVKVAKATPQLACSLAEISPDFNKESRQKCRQIRRHKL
jgi:hypothetical protein